MKSIKEMTQSDYDNYLLLDVLPEIKEEYGESDSVLIKEKSIQFAKACKKCGDMILIGPSYSLCNELADIDFDSKTHYIEILTGLDVLNHGQVLECECYDEDNDYDKDVADEDDGYDTYLDLDEDYGDGNYEY